LPPKTMGKRPPPRVPPVRIASLVPPTPPTPSIGWLSRLLFKWRHLRQVLRPSLTSSMGAILAPAQTKASKAARASPAAGRLH
jgi:hypothetical protein